MYNALKQLSIKMDEVLTAIDEELQKSNTEITPEQKKLYEQNYERCNQLIDSGMDVETAFRECGFLKDDECLSENDKELIKSLKNVENLLNNINNELNNTYEEESEYE